MYNITLAPDYMYNITLAPDYYAEIVQLPHGLDVRLRGGGPREPQVTDWILNAGVWDDLAPWADTALWKDAA
jgi:hypothetical protein